MQKEQATMSRFDEFLDANQQFSAAFDRGDLPMPPARHVAVVACMDARLHPEKVFGIDIGDAHVIRNAGGRVSEDVIRSLVISERLLGTTEVVVLHHTDCGMLTFTNEQLADKVQAELGVDVHGRDFLAFSDLEQSVRDDVTILRQSPLIPQSFPVSGAIYDVTTGIVHEIVRA
jgi:carbonic anhydrase